MISIIVPIYRTEAYLRKCIESVLSQSYADFELILVDDGSPDQAGAICEEYAGKDTRIKVLHQKNAGVSEARNAGIRCAREAYVFFLDSDDEMAPNALENIAHAARDHEPDMFIVEYDVVEADGSFYTNQFGYEHFPKNINGRSFMQKILREGLPFIRGSCTVVFKRQLLADQGILFNSSFTYGEDMDFNMRCIFAADAVCYVNCVVSRYGYRADSVTRHPTPQQIQSNLEVILHYFRLFYEEFHLYNMELCNDAIEMMLCTAWIEDPKDREEIKQLAIKNRDLFRYAPPYYRLAPLFWGILGYAWGSRLFLALRKAVKGTLRCVHRLHP